MEIDEKYVDLIIKHKKFRLSNKWHWVGICVVLSTWLGAAGLILWGIFVESALPLLSGGLMLFGAIVIEWSFTARDKKLRQRFRDIYRETGELPPWEWPSEKTDER